MKNLCVEVNVPFITAFEVEDDFDITDETKVFEAACGALQSAWEDNVLSVDFEDPDLGITLSFFDVIEI